MRNNNDHPLKNPVPREIQESGFIVPQEVQSQSEVVKPIEGQLEFEFHDRSATVHQYVGTARARLSRWIETLSISPFWQNPAFSFMVMSYFWNIAILFFGGIIFSSKLPPTLQLFYDSVEETWNSANIYWHIIVVPVLLILMLLIQIRFLQIIFKVDRRLSYTIAWITVLVNVLLFIAIGEIYSLNPIS